MDQAAAVSEWVGLSTQQALEKSFSLRDTTFIHLVDGGVTENFTRRVTANYQRRPGLSAVLSVYVEHGVVVGTTLHDPWGSHDVVVLHHPEFGDLDIDEKIADIIKALWERRIVTVSSCQSAWMDDMDQLPGGIAISVRLDSFPPFMHLLAAAMAPGARRWFVTFANVAKPSDPVEVLAHVKIPLGLVGRLRERLGLPVEGSTE